MIEENRLDKTRINESGDKVYEFFEKGMYQEIEDHLRRGVKTIIWLLRAIENILIPRLEEDPPSI